MARFVLTAQMKLAAPTNTAQIVSQINQQLKGINSTVNVKINPQTQRQLAQINKNLTQTSKSANAASGSMEKFGRDAALAIRRFSAFVAATFAFRKFISAIKEGFGEAIKFERELIKIAQVTDTSVRNLTGLTSEISRLSTTFGVSSAKLLQASRILAQTGLSANETRKSLQALAKSDLAPTFDNIINTTEGTIAIFRQFRIEAKDLEATLGSINAVSSKFAVESSDIITAVRRTGGAFAAAGGELNELIALFTSVRATSRESAESIATGFRTIFTRLQRTRTINFLSTLGIDLRDLEGQFVGPLEAIKRLNAALKSVRTTDPRFAQIVEELGGFRQISKVIPLIQQFGEAQKALNVAQQGNTSLSRDAAKAQQALSVQIAKVGEEFNQLVRKIAGSSTFQRFAKTALRLASALIKVADALTPLIGIISALSIPLATSGLAKFLGSASKGKGFLSGLTGFATGGLVPGTGNRDTVPAALTPGEFVLTKKAVKNIGVENLQGFNKGGLVQKFARGGKPRKVGGGFVSGLSDKSDNTFGAVFLRSDPNRRTPLEQEVSQTFTLGDGSKKTVNLIGNTMPPRVNKILEDRIVVPRLRKMILDAGKTIGKEFNTAVTSRPSIESVPNKEAIIGSIFEGGIQALGPPFDDSANDQRGFDFPGGLGSLANKFGDNRLAGIPVDAKRTATTDALDSLSRKVQNFFAPPKQGKSKKSFEGNFRSLSREEQARRISQANLSDQEQFRLDKLLRGETQRFTGSAAAARKLGVATLAQGGNVDSVPALLTPGEFVVNKKAAARIGTGTLERLNKVQKFASGGSVGAGRAGGIGGLLNNPAIFLLPSVAGQLVNTFEGLNDTLGKTIDASTQVGLQFVTLKAVLSGLTSVGFLDKQGPAQLASEKFAEVRTSTALEKRQIRNRFAQTTDLNFVGPVQPQNTLAIQEREVRARRRAALVENRQAQRAASIQRGSVIAGAAGGALLNVAGGLVSENANAQIARGVDRTGQAGLGGALSGAGTGAAIGAVFGPFGIAIGGAVGGLIGFATATQQAEKALASAKFGIAVGALEKSLEDVSKGSSSAFGQITGVATGLSSLDERFRTATSPEELESLNGAIRNTRNGIQSFFDQVATGSSSLAEFQARVGEDTIDTFTRLNGINLEEFNKSINDAIELRQRANQQETRSLLIQRAEIDRIRNLRNFSAALQDASLTTNKFIEALDGGNIGGFSELFKKSNVADVNTFRQVAQRSVGSFGPGGQAIANQAVASRQIQSSIVDVLLKLRTQDPLGQRDDFSSRLGDEIENIIGDGVDVSFIRKAIIDKAEQIKGGDAKDEKIIAQLNKDLIGTSKKFIEGLQEAAEVVASAEKAVTDRANIAITFAKKRIELEAELLTVVQQGINISEQRALFRDQVSNRGRGASTISERFTGRRFSEFFNDPTLRRRGINAGGATPQVIGSELTDIRREIKNRELENRAPGTDPQRILDNIEANRKASIAADRLEKSLKFLADTTNTTAAAQQQLAKLTAQRDRRFSIAERFAAGSDEERGKLAELTQVVTAIATGRRSLDQLGGQDRSEVISFLKELGDDFKIATGANTSIEVGDLRRRILEDIGVGGAGITFANQEERAAAAKVDRGFALSEAANNALANTIRNEMLDVVKAFDNTMQSFANRFQALLLDQQRTSVQRDLDTTGAEASELTRQLESFRRITSVFGAGEQGRARGQAAVGNIESITQDRANLRNITNARVSLGGIGRNLPSSLTASDVSSFGFADSDLSGNDALRGQVEELFREAQRKVRDSNIKGVDLGALAGRIGEQSTFEEAVDRGALALGRSQFESRKAGITDENVINERAAIAFRNGINQVIGETFEKFTSGSRVTSTDRINESLTKLEQEGLSPATIDIISANLNQLKEDLKLTTGVNEAQVANRYATLQQKTDDLTLSFDELEGAIDRINLIEAGRQATQGFATGGVIPGVGTTDSVRALLTPGEFVMRRAAVEAIGVHNLQQMNQTGRTKFQNGGLVSGGTINIEGAIRLQQTIAAFSNTADQLSAALNNFPRQVDHTINGQVEVIVNGAEVLTRIMPAIQDMVTARIKDGINKFTKDNFPELGQQD